MPPRSPSASRSEPVDDPSADELQALVQRLASADLDSALELSRLLAATYRVGELAEQLVQHGRAPVALAWLRRITREVDTLHTVWHKTHAQQQASLPAERRARADRCMPNER